jgi:hypothetical protein
MIILEVHEKLRCILLASKLHICLVWYMYFLTKVVGGFMDAVGYNLLDK